MLKITIANEHDDRSEVLQVEEEVFDALLQAATVGLDGGPEGSEYDRAWDVKTDMESVLETLTAIVVHPGLPPVGEKK